MKIIYKPVSEELREAIADAQRHLLAIDRIVLNAGEWDAFIDELTDASKYFVGAPTAPPALTAVRFMGVRVVKEQKT